MKRVFDFIVAAIAIICIFPVFIVLYVMIKCDSQGPVLFCQRRIGIYDKVFKMYKFRTMIVGTPEVATDKLKSSHSYITRVGYYLRKYSLDELPQLFNIIAGDMSFVGPRPALFNQYDLRQSRNELGISKIRPGLTGWAQINGRDEISLSEKVAFDKYYLEKQSFLLDIKIIFLTLFSVYHGNGVKVKA